MEPRSLALTAREGPASHGAGVRGNARASSGPGALGMTVRGLPDGPSTAHQPGASGCTVQSRPRLDGDHVMGPQPSLPRQPGSARATGVSILLPELPSAQRSLRLGTDAKASGRLRDFVGGLAARGCVPTPGSVHAPSAPPASRDLRADGCRTPCPPSLEPRERTGKVLGTEPLEDLSWDLSRFAF